MKKRYHRDNAITKSTKCAKRIHKNRSNTTAQAYKCCSQTHKIFYLTAFHRVHFSCCNYIFNTPTKCTYAITHMYYYQHTATCFGAYCAIFRENFIVCLRYAYDEVLPEGVCLYAWWHRPNKGYVGLAFCYRLGRRFPNCAPPDIFLFQFMCIILSKGNKVVTTNNYYVVWT